jgi:hypothetical protein
MNVKIAILTLGLAVPCLVASAVAPRGLIGERYLGVDGGWERLENAVSDDGWGVGAELNMPFPLDPQAQFGTDLNIRGDYADVFDADIWDVNGVLRVHTMRHEMVTPFVGAGFGWRDFDVVDSTYVPVEAGLELGLGPLAVAPFFRYSFALDSAVDDFWSLGAKAVWWLPAAHWGVTASVTYTDYDEIAGVQAIDNGWGARVGLVFAY